MSCGAADRVIALDVGVFVRHPDVDPGLACTLAVTLDPACEADVVRRIDPDAHCEVITEHLVQRADPFDDDHTRRDDAAAGSKLLVGPVPFVEVGDVAGEQHVDNVGSESIQFELRAVPERVRCHDLGVGDLLGDATAPAWTSPTHRAPRSRPARATIGLGQSMMRSTMSATGVTAPSVAERRRLLQRRAAARVRARWMRCSMWAGCWSGSSFGSVVGVGVAGWCECSGVLLSLADGVDPAAVGSLGAGSTAGVAVDVESGALLVAVVGVALQAGVVEVGGCPPSRTHSSRWSMSHCELGTVQPG